MNNEKLKRRSRGGKRYTRYSARVQIEGVRYKRTFDSSEECEKWKKEIRYKRDCGLLERVAEPEPEGVDPVKTELPTLKEFRVRFLEEYAAVKQSNYSRSCNLSVYQNHAEPFLGHMRLDQITYDVVEKRMRQMTQGPRMKNRVREILCTMFKYATKVIDDFKENPIEKVDKVKEPNYRKRKFTHFHTAEESARILQWTKECDMWLYEKLAILYNTGIRIGELKCLLVENFSPSRMTLSVNESQDRSTGNAGNTKTDASTRLVPIDGPMITHIKALIVNKHPKAFLAKAYKGEMKHDTKFRKHFDKAQKETCVNRITIHELRHTFAVRFMENGGDIYDLLKIIGHTSTRMIQVYLQFSSKMQERSRGIVSQF